MLIATPSTMSPMPITFHGDATTGGPGRTSRRAVASTRLTSRYVGGKIILIATRPRASAGVALRVPRIQNSAAPRFTAALTKSASGYATPRGTDVLASTGTQKLNVTKNRDSE